MLCAVLALVFTATDETASGWLTRPPGNHLLSLFEVTAFDAGLYVDDRYLRGEDYAQVRWTTLNDNFGHPPRFDNDHIFVNFLGHPYQGAVPYGFARSTGLDFWSASFYTLLADAGWEWLCEVQAPSINDLVESGPASSLWGEALFRISRLILSQQGGGLWGEVLRGLFAIAADPSATLNYALLGPVEVEEANVPFRARLYGGALAWPQPAFRPQALVGADLWYGWSDAPLERCLKPFDRFEVHASAAFGGTVSGDGGVRGLLAGCGWGARGPAGAWGLYGATDFGTGDGFRWSSTSFGPGLDASWRRGPIRARLTGTAEGVLMGAAGTVGQTDYVEVNDTVPGTSRYSMGPGATLYGAAELTFGDRVWLRAWAQAWWVAALTPPGGGVEQIDQLAVSLQVDLPARVFLGAELRAAERRPARVSDARLAGWQARGLAGVRLGE